MNTITITISTEFLFFLGNFVQNGHRRPFWISEIHVQSLFQVKHQLNYTHTTIRDLKLYHVP